MFNDSWFRYQNVNLEPENAEEGTTVGIDIKFLHVVIEIMSFKREGVKKNFKTLGWTICKIMDPKRYVLSGIYQIPLF